MAPKIRKAASVILVREEGAEGVKVFLLKRSTESSFLAGTYVFPGGAVDRADGDSGLVPYCNGDVKALNDREGLAFRIAAMRELYEEAGILMALHRSGEPVLMDEAGTRERFLSYRKQLQSREITLKVMAEREELLLDAAGLRRFAHWITPENRPLRFDTHFFLASCPPRQHARADGKETVSGLWASPEEALALNMKREILLSPPTLKIIEDMGDFRSIEEVKESLAKCEPVTVLPVFVETGGQTFVVFPWDEDYEDFSQGRIPPAIDHGRVRASGDRTTRIVMGDGYAMPYVKAGHTAY